MVMIDRSDAIFDRGELSPVLARCGVPLALVRSRDGLQRGPRDARLDNQAATYFMIPPTDEGPALAPERWQWNIGEVTLVRRDRRHMTLSHFYAAWDFFCQMLDEEEDRAQHYTKAGFAAWNVERHERRANGNAASAFNAALLATW